MKAERQGQTPILLVQVAGGMVLGTRAKTIVLVGVWVCDFLIMGDFDFGSSWLRQCKCGSGFISLWS